MRKQDALNSVADHCIRILTQKVVMTAAETCGSSHALLEQIKHYIPPKSLFLQLLIFPWCVVMPAAETRGSSYK